MKTACFIGHKNVSDEEIDAVKETVRKEIIKLIENGCFHFLVSVSPGFEIIAASVVADMKKIFPMINLEIYKRVPWFLKKDEERFKKEFKKTMENADIFTEYFDKRYTDFYLNRNKEMLEMSDYAVIYYDGRKKGYTYNATKYIKEIAEKYNEINFSRNNINTYTLINAS